MNTLKLGEIGRGAVEEMFDSEMSTLIENIMDPNTVVDKARKVQITVEVRPDKDNRNLCTMNVEAKTTLAPQKSYVSMIGVDIDVRTGEQQVAEHLPPQQKLFETTD